MLALSAGIANARQWKVASILGVSESNVSGPLIRETHTMHYTVETEDMLLLLEYSFHPSAGKKGPPSVTVGGMTKIDVGGRHAYLMDTNGNEVKMHIVKKTKK